MHISSRGKLNFFLILKIVCYVLTQSITRRIKDS